MLKELGSVIMHIIVYTLLVYLVAIMLRCFGKQLEKTTMWLNQIKKIKEDKHESKH